MLARRATKLFHVVNLQPMRSLRQEIFKGEVVLIYFNMRHDGGVCDGARWGVHAMHTGGWGHDLQSVVSLYKQWTRVENDAKFL
jgi:hypothetical protein